MRGGEGEQILFSFPENMIEVTQIASFLHEINLEAQKTIKEQDTPHRSNHKANINIEIGQTPDNLKICPLSQNMRQSYMHSALKHWLKHTREQ